MLQEQGMHYRFEEFTVEPVARALKRNGSAIELSRRSFDLLLYLVQNSGKILSKDELLQKIWPDTYVDENSLAKSVSVLRKALSDGSGERSFILTLPGRGYQFAAQVEIVHSAIAAPASETSQALADAGAETPSALQLEAQSGFPSIGVFRQQRTLRTTVSEVRLEPARITRAGWMIMVPLLLLGIGAISAGGFLLWRHFHPTPSSVSVVLADFENTTGDKDFDYALNRAFQIELEQSPFLDILPRSTVKETLAQMHHPSGEPLTPELAREICERNNEQAVLGGSISSFAGKYLLMVTASSCVTGKAVGGYQQQVSIKVDVLPALDVAAGHVRKQLGESASSLARFQTPIAQATTSSLDALRAYTQGLEAADRGDTDAAQALFEKALALDPNFASAWKDLSIIVHNRGEYVKARELTQKAYDLRAQSTERERLSIEIVYYTYGSGDLEAAITTMRLYNEVFPNDAANWSSLCYTYLSLGETRLAVEACEFAYRVAPHSGTGAETLAYAYQRANRLADAKRVVEAAIAEGKDRWGMHHILLQIAFLEHDPARIRQEGDWGLTHQHAGQALVDLGFVAASQGRLRESVSDFTRAREEGLRRGDADFADDATMFLAGILWEYGYPHEAMIQLNQMHRDAIDAGTTALFRAELGDLGPAQRQIARITSSGTKNTLDLYFNLPELTSLVALKTHHPAEAVQDLEPARRYQMRDIGVPYQRARAEVQAGMLEQAVQDYRLLLANPGTNPIWPESTLTHLRLAQALALEKKTGEARAEYEQFLNAWKDADADVPLLIQARQEYSALTVHQ